MLGPIEYQSYIFVALVFIQLELFFPLRPRQKFFRRNWLNDLANMVLNGILIQLGLLAALAGLVAAFHHLVPAAISGVVRAQPVWLQAIEVVVLADIGFYLAHRAFHAVPFLWKFHAVHHSIEEMDWLAAYRVHPVDQVLTKTVSFLPVLALGFSDGAVLFFALFYRWQAILVHSNCGLKVGPLKYLLASPEFHHWHHADEPQARDKNFAGQLPVLDWIGGTLLLPPRMPEKYGTDTPVPRRWDGQILFPFRRTKASLSTVPSGDATPTIAEA